jgi:hypothetical protein
VFRPVSDGETTCVHLLLRSLDTGTALLAEQAAAARAEFLIRARTGRGGPGLPVLRRLPDGSWLSRLDDIPVRVTDAEITAVTAAGRTADRYRLVTTPADPGRSRPQPGPRASMPAGKFMLPRFRVSSGDLAINRDLPTFLIRL